MWGFSTHSKVRTNNTPTITYVAHHLLHVAEAGPFEREPTSRMKALLTFWLECVQIGFLGKRILAKLNYLGRIGT